MVKIKKTPLNEVHHQLGARMIEFGKWEMPVQYEGILEEHRAVRNKAGLFDVSHMGEIRIAGPEALAFVQKLVTNNVARLKNGQIIYTPMCYKDGGIVDDFLVYRMAEDEYLLVVNASNTEKDWEWIKENKEGNLEIENQSSKYAQLAIQGPESRKILKELTELDLDNLKYYHFLEGRVGEVEEVLLSRTGYTGELGYELYLKPDKVVDLWNQIMESGKQYGLKPAGLGARDTLRLEKKMCLYGNDINEDTHPLEAGLGWTVSFEKDDFIGRKVLQKVKEEGRKRKLIGFKMLERGIPRHDYTIEYQGEEIGRVTSGSFSPTLEENIGLGYVKTELAEIGQELDVIIRGKGVKAEIVETPFV